MFFSLHCGAHELSVREKKVRESTAGISVSMLREKSIKTYYRYFSINMY